MGGKRREVGRTVAKERGRRFGEREERREGGELGDSEFGREDERSSWFRSTHAR